MTPARAYKNAKDNNYLHLKAQYKAISFQIFIRIIHYPLFSNKKICHVVPKASNLLLIPHQKNNVFAFFYSIQLISFSNRLDEMQKKKKTPIQMRANIHYSMNNQKSIEYCVG